MPKLLFTADLHIKVGQENIPIDWIESRFYRFVDQLLDMSSLADILVIGGDLFDRIPSGKNGVKEISLFLYLISVLPIRTIIYSGNHEAVTKNTTFLSDFKDSVKKINPLVSIIDTYESIPEFNIDIIPYNLLKSDEYPNTLNNEILLTHVRGEIPPHVKPEIDLDKLSRWTLVLAGDLHSYENCQRNILYPGSPYTTSFHRSKVKTGAILLDTNTLNHEWLQFDLPQLIKKTLKVGEPIINTTYDHTVFEVEGNVIELASITDKNITKKLETSTKESSLILTKNMKIIDELKEYLLYICMLDEEQVNIIINEYSSTNPESKL